MQRLNVAPERSGDELSAVRNRTPSQQALRFRAVELGGHRQALCVANRLQYIVRLPKRLLDVVTRVLGKTHAHHATWKVTDVPPGQVSQDTDIFKRSGPDVSRKVE